MSKISITALRKAALALHSEGFHSLAEKIEAMVKPIAKLKADIISLEAELAQLKADGGFVPIGGNEAGNF